MKKSSPVSSTKNKKKTSLRVLKKRTRKLQKEIRLPISREEGIFSPISKEAEPVQVSVVLDSDELDARDDGVILEEISEVGEGENENEETKRVFGSSHALSFWKKTIFFFLGLSFLVAGLSAFVIFFYKQKSGDVRVKIEIPKEVYRGTPFEVEAQIENLSEVSLEDSALTLLTSSDFLILDKNSEQALIHVPLGEIVPGGLQKKKFTLVPLLDVLPDTNSGSAGVSLFEDEDKRVISAELSYGLGRSTGFTAKGEEEVKVKDSALKVEVKQDEQILNGSTFRFQILYKNTSRADLPDLRLGVQYPDSFRFISASIAPDSLYNYWKLGSLRGGSSGVISIQGRIEGADGSEFSFPVTIYGNYLNKDYPIAREGVSAFSVSPSPLALQTTVNGSEQYVATIGDSLKYVIRYTNNSGVPLSDVVIYTRLTGGLFDLSSLQSNSSLDSRGGLRWDKENTPALSLLAPGSLGEVEFTISLKNGFSGSGDKNYQVRVNVEASSPTVPYYLKSDKTSALQEVATKIAGFVSVDAKAFRREEAGISNDGEFPPRVGQAGEYVVTWTLRNHATDIRSAVFRAVLPSYVSWTGIAKSSVDSTPSYNEVEREVLWEIGDVQANTKPLEASFQMSAIPEQSFLGQHLPLLQMTRFTATDAFTGTSLQATDSVLTTELADDSTVGIGEGVVKE
ncbi:hypothetical protein A3A21_02375 [Candidatus Jorgensenbacteria bacterium RIFCSPLOWO2_01_FULL_45_25b]|uniref:DUF11 domain-containing protein n=1 Tax=Candidatus Jorgensenbacteria bacterium RIFCSPLOWO2_01_FULL_45_25b TaxID=1798471 RepID=A0A1F6BS78_9BACT|nr:MAG: hypothetical protein A3A21_02375 [Candidatus Jorgensenbacteria bacterium RIFCSPLOWO2_01_FULL_45_25b]